MASRTPGVDDVPLNVPRRANLTSPSLHHHHLHQTMEAAMEEKKHFCLDLFKNYCPVGCDCKCGLAKRATRIVGGQFTEVNEYPWQAGLVSKGGSTVWCGGSLVNSKWVLTAAHCIDGRPPSSLQVSFPECLNSEFFRTILRLRSCWGSMTITPTERQTASG